VQAGNDARTGLEPGERAGAVGVVGVTALVAAAHGDDEKAGACVDRGLAEQPPTTPLGWQLVSRWLAVAHAVAAAREGGPIDATTVDPLTPGLVATAVPLPWAMVLAGRLETDRFAQGREIADWLIGRFGQPAREALRDAGRHHDRRVAAGARALLAAIAVAPHKLELAVLGPASLRLDGVDRRGLDWQRRRVRSVMLFLAVNGPVAATRSSTRCGPISTPTPPTATSG
jgi:hypothetical protein